jgi:DNA-binding transcriptional LysR family regulator
MPRLNLRLLEVFRAVVEENGVTEAAARLNVTQPAVSKAIAQLERDVGLRLFGRRHGRLHPSSDAQKLYLETERLFVQVATFHDRLSGLSGAREGRLIIAAIPTLATSVVASAAAGFGRARPDAKIEIVAAGAATVAEAIGRSRCDVGFVHSPVTDRSVTGTVVGESEIVAVMSAQHALAGNATITPHDLRREPLILTDAGSPPTHLVYEVLAAAGVDFRVAMEANSSGALHAVAQAGWGVALTDPWPSYPLPAPGVVLRQFRPRIPLRIVMLHSSFRPPARLAEEFARDFARVLGEASRVNPFVHVLQP